MPFEPDHLLFGRYVRDRDCGEPAAAIKHWETLVINNLDRVRGLMRTYSFNDGSRLRPDEAEDAGQEAYIRLMAMGNAFRENHVGQFKAALVQCAHNTWMDYGRKRMNYEKGLGGSLDQTFDDDPTAGPFDAAIAAASVDRDQQLADALDEEMERQADVELLGWGVGQVSNDKHREMLELTFIERLPAEAIAERLDISMANLYQRRSRGIKELEVILRGT
jgi:RNA polymerase sigma factor (sigma-70 family)